MNKRAAIFFNLSLFFLFIFAADQTVFAQVRKVTASASATADVKDGKKPENKTQIQPPKTSAVSPTLNAEILAEINLFRTDPANYVQYLEELKDNYDGNILQKSATVKIPTVEGIAAVNEAIKEISQAKPLKPFTFSPELAKAAEDHVADMIEKSFFSHKGSDGNTPDFRIGKYLNTSASEVRENLSLENETAREIVLAWLIDDGSTRRGNRKSLLSPTLKFVGIATGKNKEKMILAVATFSSDNRK